MSIPSDSPDPLHFGADFPDADEAAWMALVDTVLKGRDFDRTLTSSVGGVLSRRPIYTDGGSSQSSGPGEAPFVRGATTTTRAWDVRQRHRAEANGVNTAILEDLEGGVASIQLDVGGVEGPIDMARILRNVQFDIAPVSLLGSTIEHATQLLAELRDAAVAASDFVVFVGLDPLGAVARGAGNPTLDEAVGLTSDFADGHPAARFLAVDTEAYVGAGALEVDELAYAAATGTAYLRALTDAGVDTDRACELIEFRFAATTDQFATIAKLRAARRIWSRICRAAGASSSASAQYQHVTTSPIVFSRPDPWVNLLRATVGGFAAAVGGAQAITTLPFDHAIGYPDELARRAARNIQLLLLEESHLGQVIDPAGGSYYVESISDEMAHAAWKRFQAIEAAGGMAAALRSGLVEQQLERSWAVTEKALRTRRRALTGVSEFPDITEDTVERVPVTERFGTGLPRRRLSQPFEALRSRAAEIDSPRIFLANLGPVAVHTARAAYAKNLFEVGGIAAVDRGGFDSPVAVGAAAADVDTPIAVICSSDEVYADRAAAAASALKESGIERVYLAGRPGDDEEVWRNAGVDGFIHMGCDVVAVLEDSLDTLSR